MNEVFRKLQFKGEDRIYVRGTPAEFKHHLEEMRAVTKVTTSPTCKKQYGFRHVDYIRSMRRDPKRALTTKGRRRAKKSRA